jgi:hypothetical protein
MYVLYSIPTIDMFNILFALFLWLFREYSAYIILDFGEYFLTLLFISESHFTFYIS